ncbi:MAG TPA: FAD-dependent oxidoreductase, partial [Arthrobacter sp.]|nr:FAD-dependent oxidoreductase [Arthrobacter sp.]
MPQHAHVAVVGLGALGSAALWRLAARGLDVVGFEQFGIGHALGSSHGQTRLFREACLEHPGLAPMAAESRALFRQLEHASGRDLLRLTGGYLIGTPDSDVVAGTARAADAHGLPYERLD